MNDARYKKLLRELQKLEKAVAKDLLAKCREPGSVHDRMVRRHAAAEVGGVPDDWFPIAAGRAAVQFLLRTVYVRVLEDLGLLEPHRIRGQRGYQAFRELAPNLGRQAYFRWISRDLARDFPALFEPGPDEPGMPAEELCEGLWELWHKEDGEGGLFYDFTPAEGETFDGRFLGDLYQDLDADVRKRYALLQTPEFVESYILDYTLDPAMEECDPAELRAKGECFRMLDPTCGSGHFLLGGFKRLFRYWTEKEPALPVLERVQQALDSVVGSDLNDYAVAVARFRLLLAAHGLSGGASIDKLATLRMNLRVADSLVPWEGLRGQQDLTPGRRAALLAAYGSRDARVDLREFFGSSFHAVAGNPPYPIPKDSGKRQAYREFWPNSSHGRYQVSAPFTERFFRLPVAAGFVGLITANAFMKKDFGKPLIERVLPRLNLTHVVDASNAAIPGHGWKGGVAVCLLFGRNQRPDGPTVLTVMSRAGEPPGLSDPTRGRVWASIAQHSRNPGYQDEFVSVRALDRQHLASHEWSLAGGEASELSQRFGQRGQSLAELGVRGGHLTKLIQDECYLSPPPSVRREGFLVALLEGKAIRDWSVTNDSMAVFPYRHSSSGPPQLNRGSEAFAHLWRYRQDLLGRKGTGFKTIRAKGAFVIG